MLELKIINIIKGCPRSINSAANLGKMRNYKKHMYVHETVAVCTIGVLCSKKGQAFFIAENVWQLWPFLIISLNFKPIMGKQSRLLFCVKWNDLSIPKHQPFNSWSLVMVKKFHPTHLDICNYSSRLGLKLKHMRKWGPLMFFGFFSNPGS